MSDIKVHSNDWDIFSTSSKFYVVRNDTVPALYMKTDSLKEGKGKEVDVLPPIMLGGEHYFGGNGMCYRILGKKLRWVKASSLSNEGTQYWQGTIKDSVLGGDHYACTADHDMNTFFRITHEKKDGKHYYSYSTYMTRDNFLAGNAAKMDCECTPVWWEAKAFWINGSNYYCLASDNSSGSVVRRKASGFAGLFENSAECSGISSAAIGFLPGGFVASSGLIDGKWEILAFYQGCDYDEEVYTEQGVSSEQMLDIAADWSLTETATAKVSTSGIVSALAEASVKSTTTETMSIALKATFSQSTTEMQTVTKRFKGSLKANESHYYWNYVLNHQGKGVLSKGHGLAMTTTPQEPANPGVVEK